ncbi:helix-turn-helix domain-containing protein [Agrobacterium rosae]|uniref:Transcriptional activator NphR n=1 Tax=Agrobacterium rosae TaxID=1972867 RepID=A0A1R3U853_9HYPH|nr:helix-turn-helix domain-containing protein [Agrobacterium rosae]SCX36109.1 Transcriptional activator NphR [Agrobacterium rosae]
MAFSLSTMLLSKGQKIQYWQDAVCAHMIPADAHVVAPADFDASISGNNLGDVTFCEMIAPTHTFIRSEKLVRAKPDEDFVLVYVASGENGFEQQGRAMVGGPGSIVLLDAARSFVHDFRSSTIFTVKIPRRRLLSRFPLAERITAVDINPRASSALLPTLIKEGQSASGDQRSERAQQRFSSIFLDAIALSLQYLSDDLHLEGSNRRDDVYRKATDFIQENCGDCELDVKTVADAVFVSPRTLSRIFAARGESVMQYVWARRLEKTYQMLTMGHARNVTDAAFDAGFCDLSHFTKVFKKKFGVSPRTILQATHVART